jgi:hypothetical protein
MLGLFIVVVCSCGADLLNGLVLPLSGETLCSLMPISSLCRLISVCVRSVPVRLSRPSGRPIVLRRESIGLPAALPTVPRVSSFGSRMPSTFSADRPVALSVPIVLPIRELDSTLRERRSVADCLFVIETDDSFLPIILPMPLPRSVRSDDRLLSTLGGVAVLSLDGIEGPVELTAGCFATVGAEELRVPIVLPIRERELVVGSFFTFGMDGVLRLLESPILEALLERAAGCSAPLGTDGLVVSIVLRKESIGLPIREVKLGLTRLLELALSEAEGLSDGVFVLRKESMGKEYLGLIELSIRDVLDKLIRLFVLIVGPLDVVLVLMELPIRDVMLGLMRPFVLVPSEVEGLL